MTGGRGALGLERAPKDRQTRMIPSQLFQALLGGTSVSADQQVATPDEGGSYGELMDAIDLAIEQAEQELAEASGRRKLVAPHRDKGKLRRGRKLAPGTGEVGDGRPEPDAERSPEGLQEDPGLLSQTG